MKKISVVLLSVFLFFCLSVSSFAITVTAFDEVVIDIPNEYQQSINTNGIARYMESSNNYIEIEKNPVNIPITNFQDDATNKRVVEQLLDNLTGANFESIGHSYKVEKLSNGHDAIVIEHNLKSRTGKNTTLNQRIVFFSFDDVTYSITHTSEYAFVIDDIATYINNAKFIGTSTSTNTSVSDDSAVPPTESITSGTSIGSPIESTNSNNDFGSDYDSDLENDYTYEGETNVSDEGVLKAVGSIVLIIGGFGIFFVVIALTVAIILIKKSKKKNIATSQNNPSDSHKNNENNNTIIFKTSR